ncbi:hypothetical protein MNBD_GAMMA25-101 [hydrothermal vent metagenome]|uniref:Doubled CXXCH motif domain-containing protein n=1 Tax=hydrothermal vent metagenome TaxID=652676 RepID=A0A3B1BRS3_9ZZZZ
MSHKYKSTLRTANILIASLLLTLFCSPVFAAIIAAPIMSLKGDLNQPSDIAISELGDIYVLDGVNHRVVIFNKNGKLKHHFSTTEPGHKKTDLAMGLAIDRQNIYVTQSNPGRILLFSHSGVLKKTIYLSGIQDPEPVALVIDEDEVIWSDRRNHQVCRTNIRAATSSLCWGEKGSGKSKFHFPFQIVLDAQRYINVVDVLNSRIQIFNHRGNYFMQVGRSGIGPGELYRPNGLALDKRQNLYVSDSYSGAISIFSNGRYLGKLSDSAGNQVKLKSPVAMIAKKERLYIVDALNNSVEVLHLKYDTEINNPSPQVSKAAELSRKNCILCHLSWSEDYQSDDKEKINLLPVASERMCYSCHHGAVVDSRRTIGQKQQHPDIHHRRKNKSNRKKEREDKILAGVPLLEKDTLYCGSCHDPHVAEKNGGTLYEKHGNPWLRIPNHNGSLCQHCHESLLDDIWKEKRSHQGINHSIGTIFKSAPSTDSKGYAKEKELQKGLPEELLNAGAALSPNNKMICQSCHQIHGAGNEALTAISIKKSELCISCHQRQYAKDLDDARRKGVHPVNIKLDEPVKFGDEEVTFVTCLTCHSAHKGKQGTAQLKYESNNGELCAYCHDKYDAVKNSDHNLENTANKSLNIHEQTPKQSGLCGTCHSLHQANKDRPFLSSVESYKYEGKEHVLKRDRLCLDCHRDEGTAEKAIVKYFSHPVDDLVLRSDVKVMPLIDKEEKFAEFGEIACVTCHNPHRWENRDKIDRIEDSTPATESDKNRDGNVLNSFLRRQGVKESFCVNCHGIEAKPKYKYYHERFVRSIQDEEKVK